MTMIFSETLYSLILKRVTESFSWSRSPRRVLVQLDREGGRQYNQVKRRYFLHETTRHNISEELSHE